MDLMLCTPFVLFFVIVFLSREKPEKQKYKNKTKEVMETIRKTTKTPPIPAYRSRNESGLRLLVAEKKKEKHLENKVEDKAGRSQI